MSYSKKIYKKDSKGKLRVLHVYTEGADLIQESGLLGGKLTIHRSTAKAKNVGKSNETTPQQQAVLQAESKVKDKLSGEYFNTVTETDTAEVFGPMLAQDAKKHMEKIVFPCWVQPKLDGQRGNGRHQQPLLSRTGKVIDTMAHIQEEIDKIGISDYLDGELYAHGLTFQENMKLIKKYRPGKSELVKYHVYDLALPMPFERRYETLSALISGAGYEHIELVPSYKVNDMEELLRYHAQFLKQGYEGTMIRHTDAPYGVSKRDRQLLKYKDFIDIAAKVVDVVPSDKDPLQGIVECEIEAGKFRCGMKFSHAEREEILTNKTDYIGRMAEIRFFEHTDDGLPRFPVCYGFRNDK